MYGGSDLCKKHANAKTQTEFGPGSLLSSGRGPARPPLSRGQEGQARAGLCCAGDAGGYSLDKPFTYVCNGVRIILAIGYFPGYGICHVSLLFLSLAALRYDAIRCDAMRLVDGMNG